MDSWKEDRRALNRGFRLGIGWWIVIVAVTLGLGAGIWGLTVATSGVRGQGDAVIERNSAQNWLDAQARFEENYADYESSLSRINLFYQAHVDAPDDAVAKTNYLGSVAYCTELVADYNADARNYLREDFRAADLPATLNPETCKETTP